MDVQRLDREPSVSFRINAFSTLRSDVDQKKRGVILLYSVFATIGEWFLSILRK